MRADHDGARRRLREWFVVTVNGSGFHDLYHSQHSPCTAESLQKLHPIQPFYSHPFRVSNHGSSSRSQKVSTHPNDSTMLVSVSCGPVRKPLKVWPSQ